MKSILDDLELDDGEMAHEPDTPPTPPKQSGFEVAMVRRVKILEEQVSKLSNTLSSIKEDSFSFPSPSSPSSLPRSAQSVATPSSSPHPFSQISNLNPIEPLSSNLVEIEGLTQFSALVIKSLDTIALAINQRLSIECVTSEEEFQDNTPPKSPCQANELLPSVNVPELSTQDDDIHKHIPDKRKLASTPYARCFPGQFILTKDLIGNASRYWIRHGRDDLIPGVENQFDSFRAHHIAKETKLRNWEAGWRTWYTNSVRYSEPPRQGRGDDLDKLFELQEDGDNGKSAEDQSYHESHAAIIRKALDHGEEGDE